MHSQVRTFQCGYFLLDILGFDPLKFFFLTKKLDAKWNTEARKEGTASTKHDDDNGQRLVNYARNKIWL